MPRARSTASPTPSLPARCGRAAAPARRRDIPLTRGDAVRAAKGVAEAAARGRVVTVYAPRSLIRPFGRRKRRAPYVWFPEPRDIAGFRHQLAAHTAAAAGDYRGPPSQSCCLLADPRPTTRSALLSSFRKTPAHRRLARRAEFPARSLAAERAPGLGRLGRSRRDAGSRSPT